MHHTDLDAQIAAATTAQGLDPVIAALTAAGQAFTVEQTGGFCMAVVADHGSEVDVLTSEGDGLFFVATYQRDDWNEGGDAIGEACLLSVAEAVAEFIRSCTSCNHGMVPRSGSVGFDPCPVCRPVR